MPVNIIKRQTMAIFAYIRVSTEMQTLENQRFEIRKYCKEHGITVDRWASESISGTVKLEKRVLGKLIRKMKQGDMLICTELSRLGRNMLMIMSILNECSSKGVAIHTIKDNFDLSDNINSKIIAFAFALAAEIERNLISQRTREALAVRKMKGVKLGRPAGRSLQRAIFEQNEIEIRKLLNEGHTLTSVARKFNMHRNTLRKYLSGQGLDTPDDVVLNPTVSC